MPPFQPQTLLDLLDERAARAPAQAAFYWDDQPVSYAELRDRVNRFAVLLVERGVVRGDRVLIRLGNGPDFFQAFYGAIRAGAIAVPVFPASGSTRIAALASLCGARILVVPSGDPDDVPGVQSVTVAESDRCSPRGTFPAVVPHDVAFLQYTSGSTGLPKGVMLSHEGLLTNMAQMIAGMAITADDCFVSWLPVYHDMGLILMTMVPLFLGAKLVLLPTSLANARPWLLAIERHQGTLTAAPDFAYRLAVRYVRDPSAYDLSSLRLALNAAEPVRPRTIEEFERAFRLHDVVIAGYGLAEATVGVSTWTPGKPPLVDARGVVSVGRPFRDIDIQIIEDDQPVAEGQPGEIAVRSPANTRGYYSDEAETARLFWRDAYTKTGDLGYLDAAGHLFVTGRLKNIIKHGGETIFPQEAEQIADHLPFVRRSAAVGIDSGGPEGEQLYVFAEVSKVAGLDEPALHNSVVDVVDAIHAQLGLRPGRVYLLRPHGIPLTHNGKIQHAALRQRYLSGELRTDNAILFPGY
ncbi:MAG: AMP-binding protein [Acidobacteria bacterium]|nr:AMP-binding protein [Acidobacteriota bacterium]